MAEDVLVVSSGGEEVRAEGEAGRFERYVALEAGVGFLGILGAYAIPKTQEGRVGALLGVGASVLAAAGSAEWCAENVDRYVTTATGLGLKGRRAAADRSSLRSQFISSSLCSGEGIGEAFAVALESLVWPGDR